MKLRYYVPIFNLKNNINNIVQSIENELGNF